MLTIGKLGASPDQLGYYEQQVAQGLEDYFSGRGEAPGRWAGAGAGVVGVSGRVDREAFMRAMAGCDPRTGERLKPEHGRAKVAAFDLTFSAPKSVSVLFAVADEHTSAALLYAHRHAVAAAFAYVEREACFTRRGRNGVDRVRGDGFLAATYRHRLSRAGDPQLHTHVVVANMTRAGGRWTSLEAHGLYEHKSAAGALYRAVLRAEVRERLPWVWWRTSGRGLFEIDGVPAGVLREFSRRRVEIEERARELTGVAASQLSRERMQGIALATRKAKEYTVDGARWQQEARARAAEHGLGPAEIRELEAQPAREEGRSVVDVVAGAAARLSGPEGLTAQHNTFARRHALAEIAGEFVQGATATVIEGATSGYLQQDAVVALGRKNAEQRFTTRDLLACEQAIIDSAESRSREQAGMLRPRLADLILAKQPGQLTEEQAAAVRALAADGQGVSVLQALAGTGKTRVLATLARVYEAGGYRVVGVAPTGRAARELADTAHIPALTIQRLIADLQESGFAARAVVLFDEAGTAPTRSSAALFTAAERDHRKIIAVGDSGQLPSVAAGGWFAGLAQRIDGPELRQVMRQHDPSERDTLAQLHDGDPDPYLELKHERGDLQVHDEAADAITATLAAWDQARREHGISQAVMIARDNTTRAILNERARRLLAEAGQLIGPPVEIADQEFRTGDRVIARRNDRYRDIDNGTLATITQIDQHTGTLGLTTDAGQGRVLDASYTAEHLEHAYSLTGHGAQGATLTSATVIGRPSEFTREWAYTSLTRARHQTSIHLIAEQTIAQRDREQYAPPQPQPTRGETLEILNQSMRRRESEPLALQQQPPASLRTAPALRTPLAQLPEAGADQASTSQPSVDTPHDPPAPHEPNWQLATHRRSRTPSRDHGRER